MPTSAEKQVFNDASRFAESQGRSIAWSGLPLQLKLQVPDYLTRLGIDFERLDVATLPGLVSGFIQPGSSGHAIETGGGRLWAEVMPMLPSKERSKVLLLNQAGSVLQQRLGGLLPMVSATSYVSL